MSTNNTAITSLRLLAKYTISNGIKGVFYTRLHITSHYLLRRYSSNNSRPGLYRILFFGTDDFAVASLKALQEATDICKDLQVVTPPDKPSGRGRKQFKPAEMKVYAESSGLMLHEAPASFLKGWNPPSAFDLAVVVSFGYFLPPSLLSAFPVGGINVHPSLLPRHRGAAPIPHTILQGDEYTGVTIQELSPDKFDAGRILAQATVQVPHDATSISLTETLKDCGANLLVETLRNLPERRLNSLDQDESQVTLAPKLDGSITHIDDWKISNFTCDHILRLHRAVGHRFPIQTSFRDFKVSLLGLEVSSERNVLGPGEALLVQDRLAIGCADGANLSASSVQVAGRKAMSAKDWFNGYAHMQKTVQFGIV